MYCRKCGKKIDYDSEFCYECLNEEMIFGTDDSYKKKANGPIRKTLGLTKGIVSMSLSYAALIFLYIALFLQTVLRFFAGKTVDKIWIVILLVLAYGALVVPLVFIKQNFDLYRKVKNKYGVKLVPVFVLNFASLAAMSFMVLCSIISVVLLITL